MEEVNVSKVTGFQSATLLKVTLFHGCFSRFLNCTNGTKPCNTSHEFLIEPEDKSLKKFADDVALLIEAQPGKQLGLHNLSSEYYKRYGHQLKLAELGFTKLNDLVGAISDYVEVMEISLSRKNFAWDGCLELL